MPSHTYVYTNMRPNIYKKVKKKKHSFAQDSLTAECRELMETENLWAGAFFFFASFWTPKPFGLGFCFFCRI